MGIDSNRAIPPIIDLKEKKMNEIMAGFRGKKTFILSFVAVASLFCEMNGWWMAPKEWYMMLGFGGMASVRAGMNK
jgi:hypothetical protein